MRRARATKFALPTMPMIPIAVPEVEKGFVFGSFFFLVFVKTKKGLFLFENLHPSSSNAQS
eukprot:m.130172 g.130172  ORF g.130172 m.130172 type:complete len:61 (-) comp19970_c0_seq3:16-198(-)